VARVTDQPSNHDKLAYLLRWASLRLIGRITSCEKNRLPLTEQQVWQHLEAADRRRRLQELDAEESNPQRGGFVKMSKTELARMYPKQPSRFAEQRKRS
jgi:hypothetical protein